MLLRSSASRTPPGRLLQGRRPLSEGENTRATSLRSRHPGTAAQTDDVPYGERLREVRSPARAPRPATFDLDFPAISTRRAPRRLSTTRAVRLIVDTRSHSTTARVTPSAACPFAPATVGKIDHRPDERRPALHLQHGTTFSCHGKPRDDSPRIETRRSRPLQDQIRRLAARALDRRGAVARRRLELHLGLPDAHAHT